MDYEEDRVGWMPDEVSSQCLLCHSRYSLEDYQPTCLKDRESPSVLVDMVTPYPRGNDSCSCFLGNRFTLTRRRHHCRACKRLVCGACSSNELSLPHALPNTDSASAAFLVGGLAPLHGPAVAMSMQRYVHSPISPLSAHGFHMS
jgi:hypothetical protein